MDKHQDILTIFNGEIDTKYAESKLENFHSDISEVNSRYINVTLTMKINEDYYPINLTLDYHRNGNFSVAMMEIDDDEDNRLEIYIKKHCPEMNNINTCFNTYSFTQALDLIIDMDETFNYVDIEHLDGM